MAFSQIAAVDVFPVLDLHVLAGLEGQGRQRIGGKGEGRLFPPQCAVKSEFMLVEPQRAVPHVHKLMGLGIDHVDGCHILQPYIFAISHLLRQRIQDKAAPIGYIADLGAKALGVMEKAQFITLRLVAALTAVKGVPVTDFHVELRVAMGAFIEDVLQPLNVVVLLIAELQRFLLAVGIVQQCLVRLALDGIQIGGGKFFLGKELIHIHGGLAGTDLLRPLGHGEIGAAAACYIYIRLQPLQKLIRCQGYGGGKPIFAHKTGRVDDQGLSIFNDGLHLPHVRHGGLELLLGDDTQLIQKSRNRQRTIKRLADHEGHRPLRKTDEGQKIQHGLVVGNDHIRPFCIFYLVPQHLRTEKVLSRNVANSLR